MKVDPNTNCPNCGQLVRLVHALPKFGGLPELQSLRCYFCNEVTTVAVAERQRPDALHPR
jgi:hypothetical protein